MEYNVIKTFQAVWLEKSLLKLLESDYSILTLTREGATLLIHIKCIVSLKVFKSNTAMLMKILASSLHPKTLSKLLIYFRISSLFNIKTQFSWEDLLLPLNCDFISL